MALTSSASAKPVAVTITFTNDNNFPGYVTEERDGKLFVSQFDNGQAPQGYAMSDIKNIAWREPDDWKAAMDLWLRRDYPAAAAAFNQAVTDYSGIASIEDSIGAQALYYYMECLRRSGNFKGMIAPFVQVQKVNLSDKWKDQISLFQGWSHFAAGKWEPLHLMMEDYEVKEAEIPGINEYTVAPNELPLKGEFNVHHIAQAAFLRGSAAEHVSDDLAAQLAELDPRAEDTREDREALTAQVAQLRSKAMTDYSRSFTVNYGAERGLALRGMLSAMRLLKKMDGFDENIAMRREAHGIAKLFDTLSGNRLPAELKPLLTEPEEPEGDEAE